MGDDLKTLIKAAGNHITRMIVESHVVYPRTSTVNLDKSMIIEKYSADNLHEIVAKIESNINLKAIDAIKDAVVILKLLTEFKESLLVDQADNILIYKGGFDIIRLENEQNPDSGRSIYIEINSCRNELIRYIQVARGEEIPWLQLGTALGVAITAVFVVIQTLRK